MRSWLVNCTLRPLDYRGMITIPISYEAGWVPEPPWTSWRKKKNLLPLPRWEPYIVQSVAHSRTTYKQGFYFLISSMMVALHFTQSNGDFGTTQTSKKRVQELSISIQIYIFCLFCSFCSRLVDTEREESWNLIHTGVRGGAVGWGTVLQAGRSRVRFHMVSLEFFHWLNP